jgi:hypothetical protein
MVLQTRARLILAVLSSVLVASTLSCGRDKPDNQVTRRGEDVLATGRGPTVMDSVPGDVILMGRDVLFSGSAGGDYLGTGGEQKIGGRIHGSIRAAGGHTHITAAVDRNVTIAGGSVVLDSAADIGRNAYLFAGEVNVSGTVRGSLLASGGSVTLNGVVGRDVEISGGELHVGPRAQIAGNLRYRVPARRVHIDPAARISGTVIAVPVSRGWGVWRWLWMLGFLVAGAVAVALFPRFSAESAELVAQRPVRSGIVGLGWIILAAVAIVIAAITVIGIPLALLTTALYLVLVYLGRVPLAVWLGSLLVQGRAGPGREGALLNFLVGGLLLLVVQMVPVVGKLAITIVTCLGIGAILLRIQALRRSQPTDQVGWVR